MIKCSNIIPIVVLICLLSTSQVFNEGKIIPEITDGKEESYDMLSFLGQKGQLLVDALGQDYIIAKTEFRGAKIAYYENIPYLFYFSPDNRDYFTFENETIVAIEIYEGGELYNGAKIGMTFEELSNKLGMDLGVYYDSEVDMKWKSYFWLDNKYSVLINAVEEFGKTQSATVFLLFNK